MTAEKYEKYIEIYKKNPQWIPRLKNVNQILTLTGYILYPLILVFLFWNKDQRLLCYIIIPGIAFFLVSIFRKMYNQPRPYEALDINPLVPRDKAGQSFPSRHLFSYYLIGILVFSLFPALGIFVLILGIFLAYARVIFGVHFPKDVLIGSLLGIISGILTVWLANFIV